MLKIALWIPYVFSQVILFLIIVGLRLNTDISTSDAYLVGSFIAIYGALVIFSENIRKKYWPKI